MTFQEVKKEIEKQGNIKIIFEPAFYNNLIQKTELFGILNKSKVSLRGWDFPHIPNTDQDYTKRPYSIFNGVEFYTFRDKFEEVFRFYQSGQFVGKFTLYEDVLSEVRGREINPGQYMDFLSLIYRTTEICLFIKNLVEIIDVNGGKLTIEINKTNGRELESIFSPNIFPFEAGYVCRMDSIIITKDFSKEEIIDNFAEIGREFIKNIFVDFNWTNFSEEMIKTHQENLLNRRI